MKTLNEMTNEEILSFLRRAQGNLPLIIAMGGYDAIIAALNARITETNANTAKIDRKLAAQDRKADRS